MAAQKTAFQKTKKPPSSPRKKSAAASPLAIETVAIGSIRPDRANVRKHGDRNLETITASLKRFGQQKPLVVDARGVIRAGNGTYAAAKALGWETIAIVRSGLKGADAMAFAIADNRTAELAEWDVDALGKQFEALGEDLKQAAGFDETEMAAMLAELEAGDDSSGGDDKDLQVESFYEVSVACADEAEQKALFDRMTAEGKKCRLLML